MAKKEKRQPVLVSLLRAVKNFDRIQEVYFKLSETQRPVERTNFEASQQSVQMQLNQLLDSRIKAVLGDIIESNIHGIIQEKIGDVLDSAFDEDLAAKIETRIMTIAESDGIIRKLRETYADPVGELITQGKKAQKEAKKCKR